MQARYYDPVIGRFLAEDPVDMLTMEMNPGYFNRYMYTMNDPVNNIDPDGRACAPCVPVAIWAIRVYKTYKSTKTVRKVTKAIPVTVGPEVAPTPIDDTVSGSNVSSSEHPKDKLTSKDRAIAKRIFGQGPDGGDEELDKIRDSGLEDDLLDDFTPDEIGDAMDKYENVADRAIDKANSGSMSDCAAENTRKVQSTRKEIIKEVRKELPK